ncbi:MAG: hypothetical protein ACLQGV_05525 [Bryobacteraceae bacterium]
MRTGNKWIYVVALAFSLFEIVPVKAQEPGAAPQAPSTGWRKMAEAAPESAQPVPAQLTLPARTWITIRVDQALSSDRNKAGENFTATLAQPLVANGFVVAHRGQTLAGVISEAEKTKGVSHLGLQVTEMGLADGRQVPVKTVLITRRSYAPVGKDTTTVGTSTGGTDQEPAPTVGVLLTHGKPAVVYPEDVLTFRLEAPVTISTEASPEAFERVTPAEYQQRMSLQPRASAESAPPPYYGYYGYPYYYNYWYSPYFWGPGFYFGWGPHYWGGFGFRGGFYHR